MNGLGRCRNAAVAVLACAACSSTTRASNVNSATQVIGPSGGTLTVTAAEDPTLAGTFITVPPGALSAATTIQIGATTRQVVSSGALGPVVDFEPSGTVFSKPVTMGIPVTLPSGVTASQVAVMAVETNGVSRTIAAASVANGLATFQASGFTDFGTFESNPDGGEESDGGGCTPACAGEAACGSSDGCGGTCNGNCDDGGCTPSCAADAACGSSNGCGGTCNANCDDGGCTPSCSSNSVCDAADGCGGLCTDNCLPDGGTSCASCAYQGETCCPVAGASTFTCVAFDDPNNCGGACGNVCSAPTSCTNGRCSCPDSQTLCGQPDAGVPLFCLDTSQDPDNCGSCGNVCTETYATGEVGCRFSLCTCDPSQARLCGTPGDGASCVSDTEECPDADAGSLPDGG